MVSQRERVIDRFRRRPDETQERVFRQLLPRTADRIRLALRSGACPHGRAVPDDGRDVRLRDVQAPTSRRCWPARKRRLAGPREALRPFVGHHVGPRASTSRSRRSRSGGTIRWACGDGDGLSGNNPKTGVFEGKTLTLGGSCSREGQQSGGRPVGHTDTRTTFWSGWFRAPRMATALIPTSTAGRGRSAAVRRRKHHGPLRACRRGNLAMMLRVLEYTGRQNLLEVWPNLCMFAHGAWNSVLTRRSFEG